MGKGIAGAALQGVGKTLRAGIAAQTGGASELVANQVVNAAGHAVNKMQDGWLKTGLKNVLKGAGHRDDIPPQGTAGKYTTNSRKKITDYFGTAPSNGTRNSKAVLNNSISGGYGEKESASLNPMFSNHYIRDHTGAIPVGKKRRRKHRH